MEFPYPDFSSFLQSFLALGGFGGMVAVLINIGKTVGWIPDGRAPTVAVGLNLVGLIGLFVLGVVKPDIDIGGLDGQFDQIAVILTLVFGFVWQMISSKFTHTAVRGATVFGTSYSVEAAKAVLTQADDMDQRG
ncbi:MAG TPA: hypothetical protein VLH56_08880 [Dissulfurispiraceae bacterium]|nr:hypothetical protein [Dissulfurispiraceae bacterium]